MSILSYIVEISKITKNIFEDSEDIISNKPLDKSFFNEKCKLTISSLYLIRSLTNYLEIYFGYMKENTQSNPVAYNNLILLSDWCSLINGTEDEIFVNIKVSLWDIYYNDRSNMVAHLKESFNVEDNYGEFLLNKIMELKVDNIGNLSLSSISNLFSGMYDKNWIELSPLN